MRLEILYITSQGPVSISDKTSYRKSRSHEIGSLNYRSEIWQAHRQQCCRCACQISERSDHSKYKSHGFETSRGLTIRRLFGYWKRFQGLIVRFHKVSRPRNWMLTWTYWSEIWQHVGSTAAETPVKLQSDQITLNPYLAPLKLHEACNSLAPIPLTIIR